MMIVAGHREIFENCHDDGCVLHKEGFELVLDKTYELPSRIWRWVGYGTNCEE